MPLHDQVKQYIEMLERTGAAPYHKLVPQELRRNYSARRTLFQPPEPAIGAVKNINDGPVPMRLFRPLGSADNTYLPALIYFHGGGMMIGDLDTHDTLCRQISNQSSCAVIAVDYRLAPENKFPTAMNDGYAALIWISQNAEALKINSDRIAVAGDSAGGTIAAVVTLMARDKKGPKISFQILIYPATDQTMSYPSHTTNAQGYVLTKDSVEYFRHHFIDEKDWNDWRASPVKAENFTGLPPALIITAGYDPLMDEGREYSNKLSNAGVPVIYKCYNDMIHGFIRMGGIFQTANEAVTFVSENLYRAMKTPLN